MPLQIYFTPGEAEPAISDRIFQVRPGASQFLWGYSRLIDMTPSDLILAAACEVSDRGSTVFSFEPAIASSIDGHPNPAQLDLEPQFVIGHGQHEMWRAQSAAGIVGSLTLLHTAHPSVRF